MLYSRLSYLSLPTQPGVYLFLDDQSNVLYVGKAKDLKSRVSSYFANKSLLGEKTRLLVSQIKKIKITVVESELESLLLEAYYIKKYTPKYNVRMTDDKSYPLIRITIDDSYPKILFARRAMDKHSVYFGPYPNSGAVKSVLKIIRRVFPYQSSFNHSKRVCLYHHLGLCPCPPMYDSPELRREYKRNIRNIIRILEGKSKKIMEELEKDREKASKDERFEEAQLLQMKINALSLITQPFRRPFEYDVNPNLREDIRQNELRGLQEALLNSGLEVGYLERIECYDISNIQGTNATGSLVVLTNGEIDKSQYRKFKIKKDGKPNDFAMMEEVLQRRMKHKEWVFPDLIIVDGGKGQVSAALKALENHQISIPLIGLAKRDETIIVPIVRSLNRHSGEEERRLQNLSQMTGKERNGRDSGQARLAEAMAKRARMTLGGIEGLHFVEISLPEDSPALHLIQRIRDEAHRFAITYHKKLRSKSQFLPQ